MAEIDITNDRVIFFSSFSCTHSVYHTLLFSSDWVTLFLFADIESRPRFALSSAAFVKSKKHWSAIAARIQQSRQITATEYKFSNIFSMIFSTNFSTRSWLLKGVERGTEDWRQSEPESSLSVCTQREWWEKKNQVRPERGKSIVSEIKWRADVLFINSFLSKVIVATQLQSTEVGVSLCLLY